MYKDSHYAARCRREQLLRNIELLPERLQQLYAHRQARIWAGAAGIVSFGVLVIELLAGGQRSAQMLFGAWVLMGVVFLVARRVAAWSARRAALGLVVGSGDIFADVERLQVSGGPALVAAERAHRLEALSFAMPVVALSLLAPLFVHLVVGATIFGVNIQRFNAWVLISLLLVGHAHLTLVVLAVTHVLRIRSELDRGVPVAGASRGFWALLWTVAASSIPGAVLLCIPPVLVALTGLLFVPAMFHWVGRRAQAERLVVEDWLPPVC